jgi:hypothetical protein
MSEAIDPAGVTATSVRVLVTAGSTPVAGSVSYASATRTITFTPSAPLSFATDYTFVIGPGISDVAGNALASPYTQAFRTVDAPVVPPAVTSVFPADGSANVPINVVPAVTFSIAMDPASIGTSQVALRFTGSGAFVPGTVEYDAATRVARFTPSAPLANGTNYTIQISGVKSGAGVSMSPGVATTFSTAAASDNTAPTVLQTDPADGASQVSLSSSVRVSFSEPLNPSTVSSSSFILSTGGTPVAGSVSYDAPNRIATFTPASPLSAGAVYTATIATVVTDAAGNPLASPVVFSFTAAQQIDATPPAVVLRAPAPGETGVSLSSSIRVGFNEPMDAASISAASFAVAITGGADIGGSVSFDAATRVATFTPFAPLANSQSYTVRVTSGIKDIAGNSVAAETWTFTTTGPSDVTPPTIVSRTPAPGATGVSINVVVQVGLSEAMSVSTMNNSTFSVSANGASIDGFVVYNPGTQVVAFTPVSPLAYSQTYTVSLTSGIQDLAGNALAGSTWTFTTQAPPDNTPPTIVSRSPSPGATGVAVTTTVRVGFSEAMKASTITTSSFTIAAGGTNVPGTVAYDVNTRVATFTPTASLANGQAYTVTLSTAIQDAAGNGLSSADVFSFTTATAAPTEFIGGEPFFAGSTDLPKELPGMHVHINFTQDGQNIGFSTAIPGSYYFLALNQPGLDAIGPYTPGYTVTGIKALSGTLVGQQLNFTCTLDNDRVFNFTGTVSGNVITGTFSGATLVPTPIKLTRSGG